MFSCQFAHAGLAIRHRAAVSALLIRIPPYMYIFDPGISNPWIERQAFDGCYSTVMVIVLQGFNAKYSKLHSRIVRTRRARPYTVNKNTAIDIIPAMTKTENRPWVKSRLRFASDWTPRKAASTLNTAFTQSFKTVPTSLVYKIQSIASSFSKVVSIHN